MRTIIAPKIFTINYIEEFLQNVEETFSWKDKLIPDVSLDLSKIEKIDAMGLLLLYKYIAFTHENACFKKPQMFTLKYIKEAWVKYEFAELIQAYISNKTITESDYKELKVSIKDKFIIAPQALLRNTNYTSEYLRNEFIPKIENYYKFNLKCVDLIFNCFCEILLNFWEHAVVDTKSVILADGNKSKIEIVCADTGIGIVENITNYFNGQVKKGKALSKALEKGVTTKPNSNHMGFGLWLVNELVKANNGRLVLFSQGYYYSNSYGKITAGKAPFWPGTAIYVNLNLTNVKTYSDLFNGFESQNIKINFTS